MRKRVGLKIAVCFIAAVVFLPASRVHAGSLEVLPSKILLDSKTKTASIRIKNGGTEAMNIQIEIYSWGQDSSGNTVHSDTKDFVAFPKMLKIEGNGARTVRVGYRGKPSLKERAFRMYVRELPRKSSGGGDAVKFVLRIGMPVFISPMKGDGKEKPKVENVAVSQGKFLVTVKNLGNIHFIAKLITVDGMSADGKTVFTRETKGWYVFPGIAKPFEVKMTAKECRKLSKLNVTVKTENSKTSRIVDMNRSWCAQLGETPKKPRGGKQHKD